MTGPKIIIAKTGLDGHWRGPSVVADALREAGFEVEMLGTATAEEIVTAVESADIALLGLNVGGHVKVAEKVVELVRQSSKQVPIFAGGVVPPWAKKRLEALDVEVYPPGSQLDDIVDAARRLTRSNSAAFPEVGQLSENTTRRETMSRK